MLSNVEFTPTAGHYVRQASGWERVPAEISAKIHVYNTDAFQDREYGPMVGNLYSEPEYTLFGQCFSYEVRVTYEGTVHFATITFDSGERAEVRNSARPRAEGQWYAAPVA